MKKLFLAAIAFGSISYASAQATEVKTTEPAVVAADEQVKRTPVKMEELPAEVRQTLSTSYAGWTPASAYWSDSRTSSYFEVELTRGDEKTVARIDKSGQVVQ